MKFRIENYLIIFLIILLIISFAFLKFLKTDSAKCLADPVDYSLKALEKATGEEVTCTCYAGDKVAYLGSNKTNMVGGIPIMQTINLSDIKLE